MLAAGYATRLYPLTLDRPKPLLEVGGRPILDRLLERLAPIEAIDGSYVITNSKFAPAFQEWTHRYPAPRPQLVPTIVDDGTTDDSNKRGAIGDLYLLLEREIVDDDLVVTAGDSVFSESLEGFGRIAQERQAPVTAVYDVGELEAVRRYASITTDDDGRITAFEEKPERPTSTLAGVALYFYPRETLPLVRRYVAEGNDPDQPGRLVEWMYTRVPFFAWRIPGRWFDIGSKETLEEADRAFADSARS